MTPPSRPVAQRLLFFGVRMNRNQLKRGEKNGMGNPDHNGDVVRDDGNDDVGSDERRSAYETECNA